MIDCEHPVQFHGLCALCGKEVVESKASFAPVTTQKEVKVSSKEAERMWKETHARLVKGRKLSLILDLDQTLLHASVNAQIGQHLDKNKDIHMFTLPDSPQLNYYIKLRPYVMQFLEQVGVQYEFYIYTMGTRAYANAVREIIDPKHELFRERIITRDENLSDVVKNLQLIFPTDRSMVLILDDRNDVWEWSDNLIKVLPYTFFYGTEDINAPGKETPKNVQQKVTQSMPFPEKENDRELRVLVRVLQDIHKTFYDEQQQDASVILHNMKQQVLKGMKICYSSMFPTSTQDGQPTDVTKFHDWRWILTFGAEACVDFNFNVTHLVAAKAGTQKVDLIRAYNMKEDCPRKIWIVQPNYVFHSMTLWKRQNEMEYLLIPGDKSCIGVSDEVQLYQNSPTSESVEEFQVNLDVFDSIEEELGSIRQSDDDDVMPARKRRRSQTPSE